MLQIILMMVGGIIVGRLLHKHPLKWLSPLTTVLIWLLLFLLGLEVGGDQKIIHSLSQLGLEAVLLAVGSSLGSALAARWLWRYTGEEKGGKA